MHGIYFISILYAVFSYHLPVYNLFSDPVKTYFYAIIKLSFWSEKQQKNSQENSLGDDQNFNKNSLNIANCQLASSSFHVFFLASTKQTDCVFKTSTLFNLIEEKQSFRAKQTHSRLCCTAVSLVASSNSPLSSHGLTHSLSSQRFIMMLTEHVVQCEQQQMT